MRKTRKRILAFVMIVVMFITLLPVNVANAEENGGGTAAGVTTEEGITDQESAEEESTEEEASTQTIQEEETSVQTTREESVAGDVEEEQPVTEEQATEISSSESSENPVEEQTTEQEPAEQNSDFPLSYTAEPVALTAASGSSYTFGTDSAWSGYGLSGWIWWIKSGSSKHYAFCLDHGATMHNGTYSYTKRTASYGREKNWRISTALDYFYKINGSKWSGSNQYAAVQATIWGSSSPTLATYISRAWELTSENTGRKAGSSSYSSKLTPVSGNNVNGTDAKRKAEFASMDSSKIKRLTKSSLVDGTASRYRTTISLGGTAWNYFAKGGSGSWSSTSSGQRGNIIVYGMYDKDGNKLKTGELGSGALYNAVVGSAGNLTVRMDTSDGIGDSPDNPITVVMKVEMTYRGTGDGFTYLSANEDTQDFTYSRNSEGSAYFAIQVYADKTPIPDIEPAIVSIEKTDELGNFVPGCTFALTGTSGDALNISPNPQRKTIDNEEENYFEIEEAGTYTIQETAAAPGTELNPTVFSFTASEVTENGVTKIVINGQNNHTIQCKNDFATGSAYLTKYANKLVNFVNGQFVFQEQAFSGVEFKFYAAEDIYCNGTKIWSAGTEIKNGMSWGNTHTVTVSSTVTEKDGKITIQNLPEGKYKATEAAPSGYYVPNPDFLFTITAGKDTPVNNGKILNEIVPCNVQITKADSNTNKPLAGAEMTLYASVDNRNTDGAPLFTQADTVPVVVSRNTDTGEEEIVSGKWVPIKTAVTNSSGGCSFSQLPNGEYLVAETKAPSGYALCAETYTFIHDADGFTQDMHSGITFSHTFVDAPISTLLVIHKTGEVLAGAEEKTSEYGSYKQLVYDQKKLSGITFGVYDEDGELVDTVITDEDGTARAENLPFGKYIVKELETDKEHILDAKEYEADLSENPELSLVQAELDVTNKHTKLSTSVYKEGEIPKFYENVTDDTEDIYSYAMLPLAGVVFGVYAGSDITDYKGNVVVRKDDCLGYCSTQADGIAAYSGILEAGNYYFKEVKTADSNYLLSADTVPFKIVWNGKDISQLVNPADPVVNEYIKGSIKVIKTDGKGKKLLQGVVFSLMDSESKLLGEYETDENGEINIKNLPKGTYYLQEKETLTGYKLDDTVREINLTDSDLDQVVKIKNNNSKTSITVKTDTTINGSGNVRTGDYVIRFLFLLFMLSTYALVFMAGKKRGGAVMASGMDKGGDTGMEKRRKKGLFRKMLVFVLIASLAAGTAPAYAAGTENTGEEGSGKEDDTEEEETLAGTIFTSDGFTYLFDEYYTLTITEIDEAVTGTCIVIPDTAEYEGKDYAVRLLDAQALPKDMVSLTIGWNLQEIDALDAETYPSLTAVFVKNVEISISEAFPESVMVICYKDSLAAENYMEEWEKEPEYFYTNVSYETDGGTNAAGNPDIYYLGEEILLEDSEKSGYTFAGWYLSADFEEETAVDMLDSYTYDTDITLYAKFVKSEYSITYILNGGTNAAGNPAYYTYGTGCTLYSPVRSGHRFEGWYTDEAFINRITDIGMDASKDYILYAKWTRLSQISAVAEDTEIVYTVKYVLNGGTNAAGNPAEYKQTSETITLKNPKRAGYTFGGWYTSKACTKSIRQITAGSSGNLTLYAKWNKVTVKKVTVKSLKNIRTKKATVAFKKVTGAKGYQIKYSTTKKFAKSKTKTVNTVKTSCTLKKLKKNKTYYVKVRAYKLDSTGAKVYGKYSTVKKIKIKK